MDKETDPMLGDAETQQEYLARLLKTMAEQADSDRASRRRPSDDGPTILQGATGFGDGIQVVE